MRILMLGNSYTFFNDMPQMLHKITGAEVIAHTRGGARLSEQLNTKANMGFATQAALLEEKWDYVVLQEYSNGPIVRTEAYLRNVELLCNQAKDAGAKPVIYATWAYAENGKEMQRFFDKTGITYSEMYEKLHEMFLRAAEENDALIADAGTAFYKASGTEDLFHPDGSHPSQNGSRLIAKIIADVIMNDWNNK